MGESKPMSVWLRAVFGLLAAVNVAWIAWTTVRYGWPDDPDFLAMSATMAIIAFYFAFGRLRIRGK